MIAVRLRERPAPERGELLSIGERARYLFAVRAVLAVAPIASTAFGLVESTVGLGALAAASAVYLVVSSGPTLLEGRARTVVVPLVRGLLLLDGLYLAGAVAVTGGTTSHLRFLAFGHVVAVTLLFSYRSGLKIALWHTLLYVLVAAAAPTGILGMPGSSETLGHTAIVTVIGLWLTALGTATFAALSERDLRRQKVDLERLSSMLESIQAADDADEIGRILLDALCETFGFQRGALLASPDGELSMIAVSGIAPADTNLIGMEPLTYRARSERSVVAVQALDPETDPQLATLFPAARNVLLVPLVERGRSLGLLVLEQGGSERTIRRSVIAMVEQFASHGALALNNAWLSDERLARMREIQELQQQLEIANAHLEATVEERTAELRTAIAHLEEVDQQRRKLLDHVVRAGEEERRRIAGDIHDDPVQKLVALKMRLELIGKAHPEVEAVPDAVDAVLGTIHSLRHLLFDLRPPVLDEQGLGPALRSFLENSEATFRWKVEDELTIQPPAQTRLILYRIAQEALTNARKHSEADRVTVRLYPSDGGVVMEISDDGIGFQPLDAVVAAPGHMGLAAIRERAEMAGGRCELHSLPGQGTTLDVWIPMADTAADVASPDGLLEDAVSV